MTNRVEDESRVLWSAIEQSPAVIVITDPQGVIQYVNAAFTAVTGYTAQEAIGNNPSILKSGAQPKEFYDELWSTIRAGRRWTGEFLNRKKNGEIFNEVATISPVTDDRGAIQHYVAVKEDVTEKKRLEEARRAAEASAIESEKRLRHIMAFSPAVILALDVTTRPFTKTWISESVERVTGYTVAEAMDPAWWRNGLHPDDRDSVLGAAAEPRNSYRLLEYRFRHKDGRFRWLRDEMSLVGDASGAPAEAVVVLTDVTERREAEAAARRDAERDRVVFEDNPVPLWVYDPHTLEIVAANQAAADQYGYTRAELATMLLSDMRGPEEVERLIDDLATAPPGRRFAGTWKHRRKDGRELDVDVHLNDIEIGGRRLKMSVLHDVTPQRALEQQLRQAQKMEAVGRLAGGVAHDFNNLLTVVLGHTELALAMLDGSHAVRSGLLEVQKAGSRAATLTNQLLVFSRKHVLDPKVVDVNAVVESTTRMLRRVIGEDVRVHVDLASPLHLVKADAGQIEQVVMNLAINARDAMPKGGDLTIRTRNVDVDADFAAHRVGMAPGPYVLLSMQDVGIGMTAEVRAHLFEPFFTTKEPGKGTGLGLSTVYAIVKQWGGTIWLESEAGRGTVFDVYFPCTRERETARSSEATMRALARGEETVLLVEDEEMVRDLAKEILTLRGYDVLPAASAESALELAAGLGKVDLVLTDLVMPGLNGRELTDRLRARWPELNVLYMSGYSENVLENRELPAGARFIQKPFSGPALAAKVREVLDLRP